MSRRLILASTSFYRATILQNAGYEFSAVAPGVDERALDPLFDELGAEGYVLAVATAKATAVVHKVAERIPDALVIGADQIAVLATDGVERLLHQPGTPERAVQQLMEMSGSTHDLINAVVLIDAITGERRFELDRHRITMRAYSLDEATAYVEQFSPLDCAGGYRIEDDADLLASAQGEDETGVIGLPLPTLRRLLDAAGYSHQTPHAEHDHHGLSGCC